MDCRYRPEIDDALLQKLTAVYAVGIIAVLRFVPMTEFWLNDAEAILRKPQVMLDYWKPIRTGLLLSCLSFILIRMWLFEMIIWNWLVIEDEIAEVIRATVDTNGLDDGKIDRLIARFWDGFSATGYGILLTLPAVIVILFKGITPSDVQPTFIRTLGACALITAVWTAKTIERITSAFLRARIEGVFERIYDERPFLRAK
jgi:hypothetical protein